VGRSFKTKAGDGGGAEIKRNLRIDGEHLRSRRIPEAGREDGIESGQIAIANSDREALRSAAAARFDPWIEPPGFPPP
jgi:hypothetical protein